MSLAMMLADGSRYLLQRGLGGSFGDGGTQDAIVYFGLDLIILLFNSEIVRWLSADKTYHMP